MIRVALNHKTIYRYDRPAELGPQVVRLRPAPHCRTPITSYSLRVKPEKHFLNWQQDPHGNYLARLVLQDLTPLFGVEVDLVAEMTVINPFDFFLESAATDFPFRYESVLAKDLTPFLHQSEAEPLFAKFVEGIDLRTRKTMDFLVDLNQKVYERVDYVIRMEPGVQSPEETLQKGRGSCRDSAWLMVEALRHLGLAARFVSGYLIQLKPDVKSLDGPSGPENDFTDLHAWAEVFLPGAGWIGLDPTSGLLAGEGHIPVACTPEPVSAAPITGTVSQCDVKFEHQMKVTRVHEDPRVTQPYTDNQWQQINEVGHLVDEKLNAGDVRLTMGGEPTFVSIDDMDGDEWKTAAVGPTKRILAGHLIDRLGNRFAKGGFLHHGQGKWYPGESLPRWTLTCLWRVDGKPVWKNPKLLADPNQHCGHLVEDAESFGRSIAEKLNVNADYVVPAYEDALYYLWKEHRLPMNTNLNDAEMQEDEDRVRLARALEQGLGKPVGCVLPLMFQWWQARPGWRAGPWPVKSRYMFLIPGDSPMGLRLPLDSLPTPSAGSYEPTPRVPFEAAAALPEYERLRQRLAEQTLAPRHLMVDLRQQRPGENQTGEAGHEGETRRKTGDGDELPDPGNVVRTAMCVQPRNGTLHVFMPPLDRLEDYLELLAAIEQTAEETEMPVVIEGYLPPPDYRLKRISVAPDPGVIEVNVHPAHDWNELVEITSAVYEDAHHSRLGTEKFDTDGTHTGTGGGNHIVMGAATPADSPFLRRSDLLRSLLGYWHNHPSLSYLFSGRFIGPTSQAPRVDEGRCDAAYELQIAFEQIPEKGDFPPWLIDRVFRHLLVDLTGNTHRAEFCIDKLYSPDSSTGRLGLVEFRAFEMPPHVQMSLTQQLLLRALVARFWEKPYNTRLTDWDTSIHDRWMLPHFLQRDLDDVIDETRVFGIPLDVQWFAPHFEFRFPLIGRIEPRGMLIELRTAIEPWYVLGEEPAAGGTARYVDSSVERLQVKVQGLSDTRYIITCNGRKVPLRSTGVEGEYIAGIRYRAWQPPSCLHPTIPVDEPLVFDLLDTWMHRSMGGCRYHVGHPGGLNPDSFPVNAYEAESRRAARFSEFGHTGGEMRIPYDELNAAFPMTLDLRRSRPHVR